MNGMLIYLLFMVPPMLLALWAQARVKSSFAMAQTVRAASGLSGAETAAMVLEASGVRGVRVEESRGFLSDHYDPRHRVVRLSPQVFHGRSVAAAGIAAHEVGHAIQHAQHYLPLKLRNGVVPLAGIGSNAGIMMIFVGMLMGGVAGLASGLPFWIMIAGIGLFSTVVLFQLINLPVEFDASARARRLLVNAGLVAQGQQSAAMNRVLSAAAMTYVAATVGAIATLLYYVFVIMSAQNSQRN